ncbi:MAG: nucleoid-structuring protein H-NS, partial [Bacteroidota bacterium]
DAEIKSALQFFSSEDVPVLIIISREGSIVDYDKPTSISRYLNFLRDQKSSKNVIDAMQLDANGKIKELDLIKQ